MRKMILFLALASAALPMTACQTVQNVDTAVALANQNVGEFTLADEKGWYYAEALYNVPTQAYLSANSRFKTDPRWLSIKVTVKPKLQQLNRLRQDVYQAYKTANAVTFREKIAQMKVLSDEVRGLIPGSAA